MGCALLALLLVSALGLQLDIHLVPSSSVGGVAVRLSRLAPHNQINFANESDPHVTLYLTDFVDAKVRARGVLFFSVGQTSPRSGAAGAQGGASGSRG